MAAALWGGDPWAGLPPVHGAFLRHGDVGWRAQGSGCGPDAGRRGQRGWGVPGLQATAGVHAQGSVFRGQGKPTTCQASGGCSVMGTLSGRRGWAHFGEAQGWPRGQMAAESSQGWGQLQPAWSQRSGALLPQYQALFNSHCFQQRFFYLPPKSTQRRGIGWETGHRAWSPRRPSMPLRVDTHLPTHSCAQNSCPHPWTW